MVYISSTVYVLFDKFTKASVLQYLCIYRTNRNVLLQQTIEMIFVNKFFVYFTCLF